MSTISRMASGPRPSNSPRSFTPFSALLNELQEVAGVLIAAGGAENGEFVERLAGSPPAPATVRPRPACTDPPSARRSTWPTGGLVPLPNGIVAKTRIDRSARRRRRPARRAASIDDWRSTADSRGSRRTPGIAAAPGRPGRPAGRRVRATAARRWRTSRSNTASGWSSPACLKSVAGGKTISSTVTPGGASIVSTVGMRVGSRGLSDCVCSPSGSATFSASRTFAAACTAACSTTGVTSARGRPAPARFAARTEDTKGTEDTEGTEAPRLAGPAQRPSSVSCVPCVLCASLHFFQRNRARRQRQRRRINSAFDRREILEHEVPLPPLRRIRVLEPVPRFDRPVEPSASVPRAPARPESAPRYRCARAPPSCTRTGRRARRRGSRESASLPSRRPARAIARAVPCRRPCSLV